MQALLSKLPAFALPFVTRSLRGGRGKRYVIFSLVIAALTGIVGLWLALGNGSFEQSLRVEMGLEAYEFDREREAFTVYTHDLREHADTEREIAELRRAGIHTDTDTEYLYTGAYQLFDHGRMLLEHAASSPVRTEDQARLRDEARALLGLDSQTMDPTYGREAWADAFWWHDAKEVAVLERVLEAGGVPAVEGYSSPLAVGDALEITGFLAGMLLAALATVFAPLLVAVQQAQERHENTLMPLTGTALSPRELAIGLASGPTAVVAIFAVPQLAIFLLCSALAGELLVAGALLAALATTSVFFIFGGQLLGQLLGHKRTPGIIGIALMSLAGVAWMTGAAIAVDAEHEIAGFSAVLPHIGLSALLAEVFIEIPANFSRVFVGTFAWTGAALILGGLTMTALARRIEGRAGSLLSRGQALLGAVTCVILVNVALPTAMHDGEALRLYLGLALLALPFALLLMARVPAGDGPPRMRKVPVPALLLEFAAWGAIHAVVAGVAFGFDAAAFHPVALAWLAWCIAVLGLIAIRVVSVPAKIIATLWAGFCGMSLLLGFAQAMVWAIERANLDELFVLSQLSPVLGLIQVGLTIWIPLSLVRHLRKNLGAIS
ncbi:hypothetical protein ENSA5_05880 [Enhygromyxa salina]|uniref:ABC-2 family transporter protein n=1 Tax=Enhygromyxa salina TaxID=215803 RepID=A0A2S9YHT8_9BACT|nr:hypothetical protein [Enhygromyxa salina]PRQ04674.1 hypothetical protein ENSA5_05880 [Enhygromyxa salina]